MHDERLLQYLEICQRTYEDMVRDGSWPWKTDSQNSEDSVDSKEPQENL